MTVGPVDNSNNPLASLPDEIKVRLVSFLSGVDFAQLAQTCTALNSFSREEMFWKTEIERTFTSTSVPISANNQKISVLPRPVPKNWKQEYLYLTKAVFKWLTYILYPSRPPPALANNKIFIVQALKLRKDHVNETLQDSACDTLKYASDELRKDKEFILEAVKQDGWALQYASEGLQNDRDIVLEALKQNGWALKHANKELRNDRKIVLEAVKQNGWALVYVSEGLRNDREIVLEAMKTGSSALKYASEKLRNDRTIVLEAVKECCWALEHADKEPSNDREIVLEAVKKDGATLRYASERLRNDRTIVLEAVKQDGWALKYARKELWNDREIVLEAKKSAKNNFLWMRGLSTRAIYRHSQSMPTFLGELAISLWRADSEASANLKV